MSTLSTSITYDETTSLVMMTLRGTASAQDVVDVYQIANGYAKTHNSSKVLVDVSNLEHRFAAIDIVNIMPKIAHYLRDLSIARVVGFEGYMHDLFLQKAKRFNVNAENFECFKSAKQWLCNN
ncbi:hypothetical protein CWC18_12380 [Pseudoalteromonas aurantia]|uniref:STAS/SEC14 domain-containing protein n=1 Tax=Pseudoalteromonas aurantia TaxID=43654 RepID=A0A5S3VC64_9GAMM|nr:hypothetical protein [Pseudoalteromonas aurantia]TMO61014.1 hypothetical protein CWC18_12380 [Pseudoalteromonas aurantia]TMO69668.1 hypothetical protein CWC19_04245 [Pseudoalteromonas aurantia]